MSTPSKSWQRLIAAALCVIATAAMVITAPAVLRSWRDDARRTADPLAPALAALGDQQLADVLPKQGEFPNSWTVKSKSERDDMFGYFRQQPFHEVFGYHPAECANVNELAAGVSSSAEVSGVDPADPPGVVSDPADIHLSIGREFARNGFDAMTALASRCSRFTFADTIIRTVRILEDFRPANGPQRFRISVTETTAGEPASGARTEYFSYARFAGLVLTGSATAGNQPAFDTLFENTLRRISAA